MLDIGAELKETKKNITDITEKLKSQLISKENLLPKNILVEIKNAIKRGEEWGDNCIDSSKHQTVVHVIGVSSSAKTSLVLDIYNYHELRKLIDIKYKSGEHTAVPCMFVPDKNIQRGIIKQKVDIKEEVSLHDVIQLEENAEEIDNDEFLELYAIDKTKPSRSYNYYLILRFPESEVDFSNVIIEYPGIMALDNVADANKRLDQAKKVMLKVLNLYPGIILSTYMRQFTPNAGNPLRALIDKYISNLHKYSNGNIRLPLISILNGVDLVTSFFNNCDLEEDILHYFAGYPKRFDYSVMFSNPNHSKYNIQESDMMVKSDNDYSWVKKYTGYNNEKELSIEMLADGGLAKLRCYIQEILSTNSVKNITLNIFARPYLEKGIDTENQLKRFYDDIEGYDLFQEIHDRVGNKLTNYKTLVDLSEKNRNPLDENGWVNLIKDYLNQFCPQDYEIDTNSLTNWLFIRIESVNNNNQKFQFPYTSDTNFKSIFIQLLSIQITNMILRKDRQVLSFYKIQS